MHANVHYYILKSQPFSAFSKATLAKHMNECLKISFLKFRLNFVTEVGALLLYNCLASFSDKGLPA